MSRDFSLKNDFFYVVYFFSGTYSIGGQRECTHCPPGKGCPDVDAATEVDCVAGEYSEGANEILLTEIVLDLLVTMID